MKKIKMLIGGVITLSVVVFFGFFIWGWKLFGYRLCTNPDELLVSQITVGDSFVSLKGEGEACSFYQGYIYEMDGNTLLIGVRTLKFLPVSRDNTFFIHLDTSAPVERICLVNEKKERVVYPL